MKQYFLYEGVRGIYGPKVWVKLADKDICDALDKMSLWRGWTKNTWDDSDECWVMYEFPASSIDPLLLALAYLHNAGYTQGDGEVLRKWRRA